MMKRILVQAGHQRPLQPGHESQTGAPGEAELVADIQHALVRVLEHDARFDAVPMPGRIDDSVQVDGAIFLHADGAENTAARGYSVGFPSFDVNRRLAHLIAEEIEKLPGHPPRRPDNNTTDMAQYYGFHHVETPGPEVLVEHGFVTNSQEHAWLKQHVNDLAHAEFSALCRFFGFGADPDVPQPVVDHDQPVVDHGAVTPDSVLAAAARAPAEQVEQYMLARPHGEYTDGDVRAIVNRYYKTAAAVGLDPLLVVAQMVEETGHLTSFWSQRPRRNPAGIGVTGEPGVGLSFPNWETAVRAHTGRLLAYSLPSGAENPAQLELIEEALTFRPLPDHNRGIAPSLKGLAGTWAADPQYAVKLAHMANDICTHGDG
jgi:N-acetylmuramoyl-L-alanine amidase/Mannosyl-glycoprotein endo-beta-N-acetylglucosaminidase